MRTSGRLLQLSCLIDSLAPSPRGDFCVSPEQAPNTEAGQYSEVSSTAPHFTLSQVPIWGPSSQICHLVFLLCANLGPHPTTKLQLCLRNHVLGPDSHGLAAPAPSPTAAPVMGCFLILVTLCCGYAWCAPQTPSHTRWSHFCPLENSDAISIAVLRWEMNGPGPMKVQFPTLPAYKSFGRRFCNTKGLVFSPVGKGCLGE